MWRIGRRDGIDDLVEADAPGGERGRPGCENTAPEHE
jgi:hypothetical protein